MFTKRNAAIFIVAFVASFFGSMFYFRNKEQNWISGALPKGLEKVQLPD